MHPDRREDSYPWRYVAHVGNNFKLFDDTTSDTIFEPGEDCSCDYTVTNAGPMPTPRDQRLIASIFPNEWVLHPTFSDVVQRYFPQGATSNISERIRFALRDIDEVPPNVVFTSSTTIAWSVQVERVGKFFTADELGPAHTIPISYPVRLSKTHGPASIARCEDAPVTVCLHNLCQKVLGTSGGRVLRVFCSLVEDAESMKPLDPSSNIAFLLDRTGAPIPNLDVVVDALPAGRNLIPELFVKFGPGAKDYSRATLGIQLFLGHVHNFSQERRIQRVSLDLQLVEYYDPKPNANLLIVTTHRTTRDAFLEWNRFGVRGNYVSNFWNASIHDGITMEQIVNGSTLSRDLAGGTICVENNDPQFLSTLRTEHNDQTETAFDTVSCREVACAMRDRGIGYAVLGDKPNYRDKLMPTDGTLVPIPDSVDWLGVKVRDSRFWIERLDSYTLPPSFLRIDYAAKHKELSCRYSSNTAWHLLLGVVKTSAIGDVTGRITNELLRMPFMQRVTRFLEWYYPVSEGTLQALSQLISSKRASEEELMAALVGTFGPEPPRSNLYHYVYSAENIAKLNEISAGALLMDHAQSLADKVRDRRPQWKVVVLHDFAAHVLDAHPQGVTVCRLPLARLGASPFGTVLCIGRLSIVRTCDRNTTCIQHCGYPDSPALQPAAISSPNVMYCIHKASPFARKLEFMKNEGLLSSTEWQITKDGFTQAFHSIGAAIVSDLVEEQVALRRCLWCGPGMQLTLLEHCPRLCAFVVAGLECPSELALCTKLIARIGITMYVLMGRWVPWTDYTMLWRMARILSSESRALLHPLLCKIFGGDAAVSSCARTEEGRVEGATVSMLVKMYAAGGAWDPANAAARSSQNTCLLWQSLDSGVITALRARERPAQVVVNRWNMPDVRQRLVALHKLRTDFGPEGEVTPKISRDTQHNRLSFVSCPNDHPLHEGALSDRPCGICGSPLTTPYIPGAVGQDDASCTRSAVSPPQVCDRCDWWVCSECLAAGDRVQWAPTVEGVPVAV